MKQKLLEIFHNFWLKLTASIPACYLFLEDREKELIFAIVVVYVADLLLGIVLATKHKDFNFALLGKKIAKKVIVHFCFLLICFVVGRFMRDYPVMENSFTLAGTLVLLSEVGDGLQKSALLGLQPAVIFLAKFNEFFDAYKDKKITSKEVIRNMNEFN